MIYMILVKYWEKLPLIINKLNTATTYVKQRNSLTTTINNNNNNSSCNNTQQIRNIVISSLSLRGHTCEILQSEDKLLLFGGITGFNKYTNTVYEINLKVIIIVIKCRIKKYIKYKILKENYLYREHFIQVV